MHRRLSNVQAFTLMEILIVVVLAGLMSGFAVNTFQSAAAKAELRDADVKLKGLFGAVQIETAKRGNTVNTLSSEFITSLTSQYGEDLRITDNVITLGEMKLKIDAPLSATNPCCYGEHCHGYSACSPSS